MQDNNFETFIANIFQMADDAGLTRTVVYNEDEEEFEFVEDLEEEEDEDYFPGFVRQWDNEGNMTYISRADFLAMLGLPQDL